MILRLGEGLVQVEPSPRVLFLSCFFGDSRNDQTNNYGDSNNDKYSCQNSHSGLLQLDWFKGKNFAQ